MHIFEHEEEDAGAHGEFKDDVEIVAPRIPGSARTQDGIVEVMQSPEQKREGEKGRASRTGSVGITREYRPGPERRHREEENGRTGA